MEWVIQDHPVEDTITKLAGLEVTLLREARQESQTIKIEAKCGISSLKRGRGGRDINFTSSPGGGDTNAKGKCKFCGKSHLGVCFLKDKAGGTGGRSTNWTKKENK